MLMAVPFEIGSRGGHGDILTRAKARVSHFGRESGWPRLPTVSTVGWRGVSLPEVLARLCARWLRPPGIATLPARWPQIEEIGRSPALGHEPRLRLAVDKGEIQIRGRRDDDRSGCDRAKRSCGVPAVDLFVEDVD